MNGIYPIIRRKRRSLIVEDVPALIAGKAETGQTQIGKAEIGKAVALDPAPEIPMAASENSESVATTDSTGETPVPPKTSNAKPSPKRKAR